MLILRENERALIIFDFHVTQLLYSQHKVVLNKEVWYFLDYQCFFNSLPAEAFLTAIAYGRRR